MTRRVERLVPLRRLTAIVMLHRGPRASLRQAKLPATVVANSPSVKDATEFRKMSTIQMLKCGLNNNLWKKKGWLCELLKGAGMMDESKQSRKEACRQYYKGQLLYIEAMQKAKDDCDYDPRRNDHVTGKDGRFTKKKNASAKPKNPSTVQYLCYAFDIPYASFKR